jgi:hypothetical protein
VMLPVSLFMALNGSKSIPPADAYRALQEHHQPQASRHKRAKSRRAVRIEVQR